MSFRIKLAEWRAKRTEDGELLNPAELDPALKEALADFRMSIHAWSDAIYSRPLEYKPVARHDGAWRLAAAWTLGLGLMAGGISGGVYERAPPARDG